MNNIFTELQIFVAESFERPLSIIAIQAEALYCGSNLIFKIMLPREEAFMCDISFQEKFDHLTTAIIKDRLVEIIQKHVKLKPIKHNDVLKELCLK